MSKWVWQYVFYFLGKALNVFEIEFEAKSTTDPPTESARESHDEAAPTTALPAAPAREPLLRRIWPQAMIVLGLGLTMAWICFLGYEVIKLIEMTI